jgi:protocatechuate 3,4-dioxygenase, alpha subunit
MVQSLYRFKESPSQTAGPYIHIGATPNNSGIEIYGGDLGQTLVSPNAKGDRITVKGHVIDGGGAPLKDALVEIWQADAAGLYNSPGEKRGQADPSFTGWGRQPTDGAIAREYRLGHGRPLYTAYWRPEIAGK